MEGEREKGEERRNCVLFLECGLWFFELLNQQVTFEEPTSGHHDVCSVDTPEGAFLGKYGLINCKTTFLPLANGPYFSFGDWWSGCCTSVGPVRNRGTPGHLAVEFVNVGGWLTHGDMSMDSCAHFLAVTTGSSQPGLGLLVISSVRVIVSLSGLLLVKTRSLVVMLGVGLLVFAVRP